MYNIIVEVYTCIVFGKKAITEKIKSTPTTRINRFGRNFNRQPLVKQSVASYDFRWGGRGSGL